MPRERYLGKTQAGVDEWFSYDEETDSATIRSTQDVQPLLDYNKRDQTNGTNGWTQSRDFRKIATLTPFMVQLLSKQYGCDILAKDNRKLLRRILNDPDNRFLRSY